jgi:hypothetical protein
MKLHSGFMVVMGGMDASVFGEKHMSRKADQMVETVGMADMLC